MRDSRKNYIIVGAFLLVMLVALLSWLVMLSGRSGTTDAYYVEFENVMGLSEGAPILFDGYPVGLIEEITFTRNHNHIVYRLTVSIRKGWEIPMDSQAVITRSGFLSPVVIDLQGGRSMQMLAPGDRISSLETTNFLTAMSSMASQFGELTDTSIKPLLDNLIKGTNSLDSLFNEVPGIVEGIKKLTVQTNTTMDRLNTLLNRSQGHVDSILGDIETASGNISRLTVDLAKTRKQLDVLLISMNGLVSDNRKDLDRSIADLHHTFEVVASHVREIALNVEATTRNLNEFTAQIRRDPGVIIRGRGGEADMGLEE